MRFYRRKNRILSVLLVITLISGYFSSIFATLAWAGEPAQEQTVYNALTDFSATENPNGVWSYQYKSGTTYTNMDKRDQNDGWTNTAAGTLQVGASYFTAWTLSATVENVLTFTAPYSGTISIAMTNGGVKRYNAGQTPRFKLYKNDEVLMDETVPAAGCFTEAQELTVTKGDVIRFSCMRSSQGASGHAIYNPEITYTEVITEPEQQTVYNALKEFSGAENPNGVWGYQYKSGTTYADMDKRDQNDGWTNTAAGTLQVGASYFTAWTLSATVENVLTFTAPYSGTISIAMTNGGVKRYNAGQTPRFKLYKNDEVLMDETVPAAGCFTEAQELTVTKGDVIRFSCMRSSQGASGHAIYNPEITYTEVITEPEQQTVYNALKEFSGAENPNGVWGYQYKSGTTYADMDKRDQNDGWTNTAAGTLQVGASYFTAWTLSATVENVLTFTAPYSGTISIAMTNGGVKRYNAGQTPRFKLYKNDEVLMDETVPAAGCFTEAQELTVTKGDVIRFACMRSSQGASGHAIYNPEITYTEIVDDPVTEIHNALQEFSGTENPGDVWSYQYRANANESFTLLTETNDAHTAWYDKATGFRTCLYAGSEYFIIYPQNGSVETAITFTAPQSGKIAISMANGSVRTVNAAHTSKLYLLHNDGTVLVNDVTADGCFKDEIALNVMQGDEIRFVVVRTGGGGQTWLNPEIEYTAIGDDFLRFPSGAELSATAIKTDGFTVSWPSAVSGSGNYTYTVYLSQTPFTSEIPTSGGYAAEGCSYTFSDLTFRGTYYVAVVADDGEEKVMLNGAQAITVFSDMLLFNACDGFTEGAQNALWQYLYAPIGTDKTQPLPWDGAKWGSVTLGSVATAEKDPVSGMPTLHVNPGVDTDVLVAFTAPYTGTIQVSLKNGGVFVPLNGAGDEYDGVNFTLRLGKETKASFNQISSKQIHPASVNPNLFTGRVFTGSYEMPVEQGDVLYFVVNRNTRLHNDDTYFNPIVEYLSVDKTTLDLHFGGSRSIWAEDVTKSALTVNWSMAFGGTGEYNYTLYISETPIVSIPETGGMDMGKATSYKMENLPPYTKYYFAVAADDGESRITLIGPDALSTIGNTYVFDAVEDYTEQIQPISSPWRYYTQDAKTGKYTELTWDSENGYYGSITEGIVKAVPSDLVTGKAALCVNPLNGKNSVIAYIAPFSGKISVDMSNGGVFAPYNGEAHGWDGINFKLELGGKTLYSRKAVSAKYSHNDRCFSSALMLEVQEGDILYFVIGNNEKPASDTTFFAPRVQYTYVEQGSDDFGFLPGSTVQVADVTKTSFTLHWSSAFSPDQEAISYKVWLATQPIKEQPTSSPIYAGNELSAACSGLRFATKYYAYIVATTASGKTAVLCPTAGVMTECPVYDAYKQFSKDYNGAGIWNYAYRSYDAASNSHVYRLLERNEEANYWGDVTTSIITAAESDLVTGNPSVYVHPGTAKREGALVFTAPYSGTVRIKMNNGGVFAPKNGADQDWDGIDLTIYSGDKIIYQLNSVSNRNNPLDRRVGTDEIELTVAYGQKLFFVVGAHTTNANDSTYFNPEIEYLEVTGGSGVIDKLEGFVIPEEVEDKTTISSFRDDLLFDADGAVATRLLSGIIPNQSMILVILSCGILISSAAIWFSIRVMVKKRRNA